jgi:tRNA-2-methylthio-N6-dimethylallyladenosine synthase
MQKSGEQRGGRFHIKTFGCQMNTNDSVRMSALLQEQGYQPTDEPKDADVLIFNSCAIREQAEQKAYSSMGLFRKDGKKLNPNLVIGFAGCVAQQDKEKVFSGAPHLDFVLGTDSIDQLPEILYRVQHGEKRVMSVGFDASQDYSLETKIEPGKSTAMVNIMKGCDNFCTYCIVPFTRGREKSRQLIEVVQDVKRLLLGGVVEVMLLGQNVNSYGKSLGGAKTEQTFPLLLRAIDAMAQDLRDRGITDPNGVEGKPRGLLRLRYTTSHPKDFDDEMIACHAELKTLAPHLHLPVQSGSPKILKRMKRYLPIETYLARIQKLREVVPGITITTDLIVGFPGEEEEDFQATMQLLETVQFDNIFAYTYSSRPGTAAAEFGDTVPELIKQERINMLLHRQAQIQNAKNKTFVGTTETILVEGPSKTNPLVGTGRTPGGRVVNFRMPADQSDPTKLAGKVLPIKITEHTSFSLRGEA